MVWALTLETMYSQFANNKGTDQPVHPCNLISWHLFWYSYSCCDSVFVYSLAVVAPVLYDSLCWHLLCGVILHVISSHPMILLTKR